MAAPVPPGSAAAAPGRRREGAAGPRGGAAAVPAPPPPGSVVRPGCAVRADGAVGGGLGRRAETSPWAGGGGPALSLMGLLSGGSEGGCGGRPQVQRVRLGLGRGHSVRGGAECVRGGFRLPVGLGELEGLGVMEGCSGQP